MKDTQTKMAGGMMGGINQSSVISYQSAPMSMPVIDVRELSDEMLIFLLQLMAPEKYGRPATQGGKADSRKQKVEIERGRDGSAGGEE